MGMWPVSELLHLLASSAAGYTVLSVLTLVSGGWILKRRGIERTGPSAAFLVLVAFVLSAIFAYNVDGGLTHQMAYALIPYVPAFVATTKIHAGRTQAMNKGRGAYAILATILVAEFVLLSLWQTP